MVWLDRIGAACRNPSRGLAKGFGVLPLAGASACLLALGGCGGEGSASKSSASVAATTNRSSSAVTSAATKPSPASGATSNGTTPAPAGSGAPASGATSAASPGVIAQADAICARRNSELATINASSEHLSAIASASSRSAAVEQRALGELTRLKPPANVAHDYHQVLAFSAVAAERLTKLSQRARSKDLAAVLATKAAYAKGLKAQLRLLVAANRAGLKDCAVVKVSPKYDLLRRGTYPALPAPLWRRCRQRGS